MPDGDSDIRPLVQPKLHTTFFRSGIRIEKKKGSFKLFFFKLIVQFFYYLHVESTEHK
jgi:hypothetical protein